MSWLIFLTLDVPFCKNQTTHLSFFSKGLFSLYSYIFYKLTVIIKLRTLIVYCLLHLTNFLVMLTVLTNLDCPQFLCSVFKFYMDFLVLHMPFVLTKGQKYSKENWLVHIFSEKLGRDKACNLFWMKSREKDNLLLIFQLLPTIYSDFYWF